jgi:hypothetical protein
MVDRRGRLPIRSEALEIVYGLSAGAPRIGSSSGWRS